MVGNVATGKTSVINRFARNKFSKDYQTTIGVDFALKKVKAGGAELNVQLWDIAGQERFAGLSRVRAHSHTRHSASPGTPSFISTLPRPHSSLLLCCRRQIFYTHAVAAIIVYDITAKSASARH